MWGSKRILVRSLRIHRLIWFNVWMKDLPRNADEHWWGSKKFAHGRPYISYGRRQNCI